MNTYEPDDSKSCPIVDPEWGFVCTRTVGHGGSHHAHISDDDDISSTNVPVHEWGDE